MHTTNLFVCVVSGLPIVVGMTPTGSQEDSLEHCFVYTTTQHPNKIEVSVVYFLPFVEETKNVASYSPLCCMSSKTYNTTKPLLFVSYFNNSTLFRVSVYCCVPQ